MLKIGQTLIVLQLSIDATDDNKVGESKDSGNETNLSNSSASKKSTGADYLTFNGNKKGGGNFNSGSGNIKKDVKAVTGFNYLILGAKRPLTFYGTYLYKCLPFNTLIRNSTSALRLTSQSMLLVES